MLFRSYRRCEENGFEECSLSKLESYRSEFYLSVSDHTNALKSSFIALRAKSKDPQSDLTWKLKSLRTISHEYIKTQNWFFAAKYLHELEDMAQNTEEEYYYKSETMLLRSLMLMMQGAPDEALVLIDSIPDIMRKDVSAQAQERSVIIKCRSLQYKGSINGFNQRYKPGIFSYFAGSYRLKCLSNQYVLQYNPHGKFQKCCNTFNFCPKSCS